MMRRLSIVLIFFWGWASLGVAAGYSAAIQTVKPSIVAIGDYQPLQQPPVRFVGTGFVVADGRHLVTNAHNIPDFLDPAKKESLVMIVPGDGERAIRLLTTIDQDKIHDLALMKFSDAPLPALQLGDSESVREGQEYLITGFPIGGVLGYHAVTHRAMVSAITPVIQPVNNTKQLSPHLIKRMMTDFHVFQLDAIAYPGNSGSPIYSPETGAVIGVVNSVFVKETKESILTSPSGISYAIPVSYVKALMHKIEAER